MRLGDLAAGASVRHIACTTGHMNKLKAIWQLVSGESKETKTGMLLTSLNL